MKATLFPLPRLKAPTPLEMARRKRDAALLDLRENHPGALLERLAARPFHVASILELLGQDEDRLNRADRERLKVELGFLKHCRTVYDAEHAATAAHLVRATQQELI